MKTLWIILPCFKVGGVEKWAEQVYDALTDDYEVKVIVTGEIDPRAKQIFPIMNINAVTVPSLILGIVKEKPDYIIAALTPSNLLASIVFGPLRTKVITSIHLTLQKVSSRSIIHQICRIFSHLLIRFASTRIIAVSEGVRSDFCELTRANPNDVEVIYNPCFRTSDINLPKNYSIQKGKLNFVAVGRFDEQKNFNDLVTSFVTALDSGCDYCLDIFGDGPAFQNVRDLVPAKYSQKINLKGNQPNILTHLGNYDIFILPSKYEGFGNVLAEALSAGLFCVARDCPHGPFEILNKGEFGLLVSQHDDLGEVLKKVRFDYENYVSSISEDRREKLSSHLQKFTNEVFCLQLKSMLAKLDK